MRVLQKARVTRLFRAWAGLLLLASFCALAGDFSVQDIQGKTHRLSEVRGKWVLVNFWATWCSPCISEIPELSRLQATHPELLVLGVAMQSGSQKKVADFAATYKMNYPVVMGTRAMVEQITAATGHREEIDGLPTTYMFGPNGELVYKQLGGLLFKEVEQRLKK